MSTNTPMSYCKDQFKSFKELVGNFGFKELNLNKSSYKSAYVGSYGDSQVIENKGVKSDFIKIFKLKFSANHYYNLGFEFQYLNLPKEDCKVIVSLKSNTSSSKYVKADRTKSFKVSEAMSIDDFLIKFNDLISQSENIKSYDDLIDKVTTLFLPKPQNKLRF